MSVLRGSDSDESDAAATPHVNARRDAQQWTYMCVASLGNAGFPLCVRWNGVLNRNKMSLTTGVAAQTLVLTGVFTW